MKILEVMISTLKAGESYTLRALINNVTTGKTNGNNKTTYLTIMLQDKTGVLTSKLWSASQEQIDTLQVGCVVDVSGDVIKYGDELQLKIEKIAIFSKEESEQVKYLKSAPYRIEEMQENLLRYIGLIKDETIYTITKALYEQYLEQLMVYPAASRNHHEYVSGLAYHTLSMLKMAEAVSTLHQELNTDWLYSGILLHDLGKVIELSGPVVPEYTLEGKLLGHISIASALIEKKASELNLNGEKVTILKHLVLAHHGKLEYGSPVLPQIAEAEVIHLIDNLDARINMLGKVMENVEEGHFSKRVFALENRSFYKPKR